MVAFASPAAVVGGTVTLAAGTAASAVGDNSAVITTIIGAIVSLILGTIGIIYQRKNARDSAREMVPAGVVYADLQKANARVDEVNKKLEIAEARADRFERRYVELEERAELLTLVIQENGIVMPPPSTHRPDGPEMPHDDA